METSKLLQGVSFACQFLYLGYWVLGWVVWKGWLRVEDKSRFGRFAIKAGQHFGPFWENARWVLLASFIIAGCAVVGLVAAGVGLVIKGLVDSFGHP
jgi:hypothetical protein